MPVSIVCSCGKKLTAGDHLAGKRVKCPACQQPVVIPGEPSDPSSPNGSADKTSPAKGGPAPTTPAGRTPGSSARSKALAQCSRCNGSFPPNTLVKLHGQMICRDCKQAALIERPSSAESNRKMLVWSGIAGVVGLLIVGALGIFLLIRTASKQAPKPKSTAPDFALAQPGQPPADIKPADIKPTDVKSADSKPAETKTVAAKNMADPSLKPFRHQPKTGTRWGFHLDIVLTQPEPAEGMESNRISADFEVVQQESAPEQQELVLVFHRLDVAKPFTDEDHRGAGEFPKNVLGKKMTIQLGPNRPAESGPGWPRELPWIADTGDEIKHDDDTKDPAGLAFKKYLTPQANDLLAQAFSFLGRGLLPKEMGNPATWEVSKPFLAEAGVHGPVTWTLERKSGLAPQMANVGIKTKAEHTHKGDDGKPKARLKLTGTGQWKYNLEDSMTDSAQFEAKVEEEAVENQTKSNYVLKLRLNRQKIDPTALAAAAPPKPTGSNPAEPEKPMPEKAPNEKPAPAEVKPAVSVPTPKDAAKPPPAEKPTADKPPAGKEPAKVEDSSAADEEKEKQAQAKLKQAKQFIELDKPDDAIDYCEVILKKWPGTRAAEEARALLKKLKK